MEQYTPDFFILRQQRDRVACAVCHLLSSRGCTAATENEEGDGRSKIVETRVCEKPGLFCAEIKTSAKDKSSPPQLAVAYRRQSNFSIIDFF